MENMELFKELLSKKRVEQEQKRVPDIEAVVNSGLTVLVFYENSRSDQTYDFATTTEVVLFDDTKSRWVASNNREDTIKTALVSMLGREHGDMAMQAVKAKNESSTRGSPLG